MPAPAVTESERERRRARLLKAIEKSGRSRRRAAHEVARVRGENEVTMETNFKRWTAETPREGSRDSAPDWAIEAVKALPPIRPETLSELLRAAIAERHVPLALAQRAADALDARGK
jgi:hypothetical protein